MTKINWDSYWDDESKHNYWNNPAESVLEIIENNNSSSPKKVLDLGCGIGRHAIAFARAGYSVTAVDNSKKALKKLRRKANKQNLNIQIVNENYLKEIFGEEIFDIIISYNVIYHGCREDFKKAINLCKKYLKDKGKLIFTCPSRDDGKYGNGKKVAPHTYESLNSVHPGDIHYFSNKDDINDFIYGMKLISLKKDEHYWDNKGKRQFSSYWEVLVEKK